MKKHLIITLVAFSINAIAQIPTTGLVGYFPFSGNANDISGSGNNGIVHNASLTTDRFGNSNSAYQFVGNDNNTSSYIVSNDNNLPSGNSARTISFWVTHNTFGIAGGNGNDGHPIIAYGTAATNSANEILFATDNSNNPFLRFDGYNSNMQFPMTYSLNTWYNVVATYNGTIATIYVNNTLVGSGSHPSWNTVLDSLVIGAQTNRTRFHNGKIDDVLIYNRVLNSTEINQIFTITNCTIPASGLICSYPFSGNANDASGSGNNGIVHNATLTTDRFGNPNSAYQFVGNDNNTASYIVANHNNLPTGNSARTISLWVTHNSYGILGGSGNDGHPIIAYGTAATNSANEILFATSNTNNPFLRFGGFNNDMDFPMTYSLNTWYNVVATYNGTISTIYVNNTLLGSGSYPSWNTVLD